MTEQFAVVAGLLVFSGFCAVMAGLRQAGQKAAREAAKSAVATRHYIEALEQSRVFCSSSSSGPEFGAGRIRCPARSSHAGGVAHGQVGGGIGTTVHVGRIPIHLGSYKSIPVEELREVGTGELVLTHHRLLSIGRHTFAILFNRLPNNATLWNFLVTWVGESRLEQPKLPDDVHLGVIGDPPKMRIVVLDKAPITRGILGTTSRS